MSGPGRRSGAACRVEQRLQILQRPENRQKHAGKERPAANLMKVPLLDLQAQYSAIKPEIDRAVADVMASQHFILGPQVQECEKAIAEYSQCAHAIGVSSGTDALLMCLMAEGIGNGDEIITTPYTFFATVGAIA